MQRNRIHILELKKYKPNWSVFQRINKQNLANSYVFTYINFGKKVDIHSSFYTLKLNTYLNEIHLSAEYMLLLQFKKWLFPTKSTATLNNSQFTLSRRRIRADVSCKVFVTSDSPLTLEIVAIKRLSYKSSKSISSDSLGLGVAKTSMWQPPQATYSSKTKFWLFHLQESKQRSHPQGLRS